MTTIFRKRFSVLLCALLAASALLGGVLAPTRVQAAAKPAINTRYKTLHLTNEEIGNTYDFNIRNKVKGSTYKWTSSDTSVATVNSKNGLTTAKKVGKATITCKITLPTKKTQTLTAIVTVIDKIIEHDAYNPKTMEAGETAAFAAEHDSSGAGYTLRFFLADNTAGAKVDESGNVTAAKAGSFKIIAALFDDGKTPLSAMDKSAGKDSYTFDDGHFPLPQEILDAQEELEKHDEDDDEYQAALKIYEDALEAYETQLSAYGELSWTGAQSEPARQIGYAVEVSRPMTVAVEESNVLRLDGANEAAGNTVTLVFAGGAPEGNVTDDNLVLTEKGSTAHIWITKITFPAGGTNAVAQIRGVFTPGKTYTATFGGATVEFTARDGGISGNPITSPGVATPTQPGQPGQNHITLSSSTITLDKSGALSATITVTEYDANNAVQPASAVTAVSTAGAPDASSNASGQLTVTADSNTPLGTYTYTVTMNSLTAQLTVKVVDSSIATTPTGIVCDPSSAAIAGMPDATVNFEVYYINAANQRLATPPANLTLGVTSTNANPNDVSAVATGNTVTIKAETSIFTGYVYTVTITDADNPAFTTTATVTVAQ